MAGWRKTRANIDPATSRSIAGDVTFVVAPARCRRPATRWAQRSVPDHPGRSRQFIRRSMNCGCSSAAMCSRLCCSWSQRRSMDSTPLGARRDGPRPAFRLCAAVVRHGRCPGGTACLELPQTGRSCLSRKEIGATAVAADRAGLFRPAHRCRVDVLRRALCSPGAAAITARCSSPSSISARSCRDSEVATHGHGYWLLLYPECAACGERCRNALFTMRQSRSMLGKEMEPPDARLLARRIAARYSVPRQ